MIHCIRCSDPIPGAPPDAIGGICPDCGTGRKLHRCTVCGERRPRENMGRTGETWCDGCKDSPWRWKDADFNRLRRAIEKLGGSVD